MPSAYSNVTKPVARSKKSNIPQSKPASKRQVKNNAGGYTFTVTDVDRIRRFLILGTDAPTYYQSAQKLTRESADFLWQLARKTETNKVLVDTIVEVSVEGRAPKQDAGLFALAIAASASGDADTRAYALAALPKVARTASTLFKFVSYARQFRGWGTQLTNAIANWYNSKGIDQLTYQMTKYRSRDGWSHGDLLRVSHPHPVDKQHEVAYGWALGKKIDGRRTLPGNIATFNKLQAATSASQVVGLLEGNVSWEMIPDKFINDPAVLSALVEKGMPMGALVRQLPRLTNAGVLTGTTLRHVTEQLADPDYLRKARIHPFNVLVAMKTYAAGRGFRSQWQPITKVVDALDAAYYGSVKVAEPTGKRFLVALDVSGSMTQESANPAINCMEAGVAMAMSLLAVEDEVDVYGFTDGSTYNYRSGWGRGSGESFTKLEVSTRRRLDDNVNTLSNLDFKATDLAMPFKWAQKNNKSYDTIISITDNETWSGGTHTHVALKNYRNNINADTRNIVAAMTATPFTVADPKDALSLDIVGLDSAFPQLVTDFAAGRI